MVALVVGLGPIGGNVGLRLAEKRREVIGLDLSAEIARKWAAESGCRSFTSYDDVPWSDVDTVFIAVRMAEELQQCAGSIQAKVGDRTLSVFVATTLAISAARRILANFPSTWRTFESPVSGGPQGSRAGTLTLFIAGPQRSQAEQRFVEDISSAAFEFDAYGDGAVLKLLNNALGALNAISTAHIIGLCNDLGADAKLLHEIVNLSSGQSWMSDNFDNFHYEMLFKDVRLLLEDIPDVPTTSIRQDEDLENDIEVARAILIKGPKEPVSCTGVSA